MLLSTVAALSAVGALGTAVPAAASEVGPFRVVNYNSGKCMDVHDNGDSDIVKQYTCHGKANQRWHFKHQANGDFQLPTAGEQFRYRFINWFSGMCLEVDGGSGSNSARVQQAPCNGSAKQLWIVMT